MSDLRRPILGGLVIAIAALAGVAVEPAESGEPSSRTAPMAGSLKGKVEGIASPGSRMRLCLEHPAPAGSRYYWVQTDGPPLSLEGQTGPELKLTVPLAAESLGFLLVVSDEQGMKTVSFSIPVVAAASAPEPTTNPGLEADSIPKADAGDDAIGLVGRRITLNGSESRPRDGLSYRWIQVDGPQVVGLDEAGRFCSFVPAAPGNYRFALVVAHENKISPADFVVVSVGTPPGPSASPITLIAGSARPNVAPAMMPSWPGPTASTPFDAAVAQALASLDDAPQVAGPLAEVFQAAALRMDLYRSYGEIFSEMSRRLDAVVPADPIRRNRWNALLFEPLTAQTVASMVPLGLDLRVPGSQDAPLTGPQKQELRGLFERLARRLAAPRPPRGS